VQAVREIALARIDCDLYAPAVECLDYLAGRLSDQSVLVFDDWTFDLAKGETRAFAEWLPPGAAIPLRVPVFQLNRASLHAGAPRRVARCGRSGGSAGAAGAEG